MTKALSEPLVKNKIVQSVHEFGPRKLKMNAVKLSSEHLPELHVVGAGEHGLDRPLGQLAGVVLQLVSQHCTTLKWFAFHLQIARLRAI